MTFTPILADAGGLLALGAGMLVTGTIIVGGFCLALTSKTTARWCAGAGLCLAGIGSSLYFSSILKYFGMG